MTSRRFLRIDLAAVVYLLAMSLGFPAVSSAADLDEMAATTVQATAPGPVNTPDQLPQLEDVLVVGTSTNVNDPAGTNNDMFTVDPATNTSMSVATGVGVWGATADQANARILFTRASGLTPPAGQIGGGDELFEVPFAGGNPVSLGRIADPAGVPLRIDGLAVSGGVLYGVNAGAGAENGFFSIDWNTLVATNISLHTDSISGIDADPDTGVIYGVNDTTGQLVTISTGGAIASVVAYPSGLTDIDGIAVGDGKAFLVTDESGIIPVYDIATATFETPLTSPFATADTFSGGAYAGAVQQPTPTPQPGGEAIPTVNGLGLFLFIGLIATIGLFVLFRR